MRLRAAVFALLLLPVSAAAQPPADPPASAGHPRVELFVGYRAQTGVDDQRWLTPNVRKDHLEIALDWNVSRNVAFVFTSPRLAVSAGPGPTRVDYAFLAGPRVRFAQRGRVTPFASVLAGPMHGALVRKIEASPLLPYAAGPRSTALQIAASGGLDLRINDRYAIRLFEVQDRAIVTGPATDNVLAVSTGVVFRFGGRPASAR